MKACRFTFLLGELSQEASPACLLSTKPREQRQKAGRLCLGFPLSFQTCSFPSVASNPLLQALLSETKQQQGKAETELGVSWEGTQSEGSEDAGPAAVASVAPKGNRRSTPGGNRARGKRKLGTSVF